LNKLALLHRPPTLLVGRQWGNRRVYGFGPVS